MILVVIDRSTTVPVVMTDLCALLPLVVANEMTVVMMVLGEGKPTAEGDGEGRES
jgi:hypothetical protein